MKWMPTSERLPSEQGDYLVTIPLGNDSYVDVLSFHHGKFYEVNDEWGDVAYDDAVAWMPLPKPYKAEQTEPQVIMPKKCKSCDSASKIIEAYSRGYTDGADAVKAMQTDCHWK